MHVYACRSMLKISDPLKRRAGVLRVDITRVRTFTPWRERRPLAVHWYVEVFAAEKRFTD